MRNMNLRMLALAVMTSCLPALGQAIPPQEAAETKRAQPQEFSVYRVEYTVRELEDRKRLNSRTYTIMLSPHPEAVGRVRAGSRVPTGRAEGDEDRVDIQYTEVGINIDCRLHDREKGVLLYTNFESSYVPSGAEAASPIRGAPIIRQVRLMADSLVMLDKPTVVGTVDDVMSNRRYEVEVTVTKVK